VDPDHPLVKYDLGRGCPPLFALWNFGELAGRPNGRKALARTAEGYAEAVRRGLIFEFGHANGSDIFHTTLFCALCEEMGLPLEEFRGNSVNDPLAHYIIRCMAYQPLPMMWKLALDWMEWAFSHLPRFRPTNGGCAYDMRESGIDSFQELAFRFANYIEYMDELCRRGLRFEEIGHRPALALCGEIDFFETIAKLRAARRMHARIAVERYGMDPARVKCPPVNTNLAGSAMTREQPIFNVIRSTLQALASVLGGVNGMELKAYTEVMSSSPTAALVINRGIEAIIAEETGVCQTVDPLAGSYYVECLTNQIEDGARKLLDEILQRGGVRACIESGWIQSLVEEGARERQQELEQGRRIQVGVNAYTALTEPEIPLPVLDTLDRGTPETPYSDLQREILAELRELRAWRDQRKLTPALRQLCAVANEKRNVVPAMIEAWKADATLGEIAGSIRLGLGLPWDEWGVLAKPGWLDLG
jgi:methylmalonyl-CoA mutase N-terminal domain/subunit